MKYIITVTRTNANGETITATTAIDTTDARTAHEQVATAANASDTIRVYPDTATAAGLARGALMVARRTAVNATMRGGNETQYRIERELAAANARCRGAETAGRITGVIADYSADTQDFFGVAMAGLIDGRAAGLDISEQYHSAFLHLNAFIRSQRAATDKEISTEYIIDGGGDIVAYNGAIAQILRGGDKWTPTDGGTMDAATAARLGAAIADAMRTISPTQRHIVELTARGYSQRQIAEKTGRGLATVARNLAIVRGKMAEYIRENAQEFAGLIDGIATAAALETATIKATGRTNAAQERKRAADKATQAERARRYRERKAAERQAANK